MIEYERVLGAFSMLADISESTARGNEPIVRLAIAQIESYIGQAELTNEQLDKVHHAAAACAYYKYVVILSTREGIDVTFGDAKITASDVSIAKSLKDDAIDMVKQFVYDPVAIEVI
ncbi:MAG: hypothetical protein UHN02_05140 [Acutalibacteraceae bacterium]|nr:hypothetical protein [Acutalibacteraceae bacterium]